MSTRFDEKTHSYFIDEKPATGVTSIIGVLAKPALIQWAANEAVKYIKEMCPGEDAEGGGLVRTVHDDVLEEARIAHARKKEKAGEHGTDTHALVEEWIGLSMEVLDGRPLTIFEDPDGKFKTIQQVIDWAKENVDHFIFSERRMFNKEHFFAGTADFAYVGKDGKKYIADFKTSSKIYGIDYWLQVAAYRFLAEAEGDAPYDGCTVVRLGKDGSFDAQHLYEYETYKEAFFCCLTLYRAQAAIKELVVKT